MAPNDEFTPETIDEQIEHLSRVPSQRTQPAGRDDASLVQALRRIYSAPLSQADRTSLERARQRILDGGTSDKTLDHEHMLQGQRDGSGFLQRNAEQWKRSTIVRVLSAVATVIIVGALVGSWVLVTHLAVHHQPTQTEPRVATRQSAEPLTTIQMMDTTTGWAVTATDHHILRTTDGGTSWKDVTPHFSPTFQGMDFVTDFLSASLAWVAIAPDNGMPPTHVYRTTDGGQTWQVSTVPATSQLGQLTFLDPQHGWLLAGILVAMGPKAVDVFRTTDGGTTWTKVSTTTPTYTSPGALPPGAEWLALADASTGWATGYSPVTQFVWLYSTYDGGATWQHHTLPRPAGARGDLSTGPIMFFNRQEGVLPTCFSVGGADSFADIYVTHDGGTTWNSTSLLPVSTCAVASFNVGNTSDFIDSTHGWVLDTAWTPAATTTRLYMTSDGGAHWRKLLTSTNYQAIQALDFVSDTVGWAIGVVASDTSFLLKTVDGGRTWTPVPYTIS